MINNLTLSPTELFHYLALKSLYIPILSIRLKNVIENISQTHFTQKPHPNLLALAIKHPYFQPDQLSVCIKEHLSQQLLLWPQRETHPKWHSLQVLLKYIIPSNSILTNSNPNNNHLAL